MPKNEEYRPFLEAIGSIYRPEDVASALIGWADDQGLSLDGIVLKFLTFQPINLHETALRALTVGQKSRKVEHGSKGKG